MGSYYFDRQERDSYRTRMDEEIRKFATLGLLRKVNDSITNDVIISYIDRKLTNCGGYPGSVASEVIAGQASFSEGMKKMTREYLTNMFWKNLTKCVYGTPYNLGYDGGWHDGCRNDRCKEIKTIRKFPVTILRAIDTIHISSALRLWDAKNAIETLHSVVVPKDPAVPSWKSANRFGHSVDYTKFDVPNPRQLRTIGALRSILTNYLYNATNRRTIPNDAEKELAIDLAEIMNIMFDDVGFPMAYDIRSTYNYAIQQLTKSDSSSIFAKRWEENVFDHYARMVSIPAANQTQGKNYVAVVSTLGHLSPNAALCNRLLEFSGNVSSPYVYEPSMNVEFLKTITPVKIPEVVVYIFTELNLQITKLRLAQELYRRHRNGENIGGTILSDPCDVPCCPDEVEYQHGRIVA